MKRFLFINIALFFGSTLRAQPFHELNVFVGGGLSSLRYRSVQGNQSMTLGANYGIGYHLLLTDNWAVGTGLEFDFFGAKLRSNQLSGSAFYTNVKGYPFNFLYAYTRYREEAHAVLLAIPLVVRYEPPQKRLTPLGSLGVRLGLPISGGYSSSGVLTTKGDFIDQHVVVDDRPEHGFTPGSAIRHSGALELTPALMLTLRAGVRYTLPEGSLILLLYCNLGLNNMSRGEEALPVAWHDGAPNTFAYRSVATSSANGRLRPIAVGVSVAYVLRLDGE